MTCLPDGDQPETPRAAREGPTQAALLRARLPEADAGHDGALRFQARDARCQLTVVYSHTCGSHAPRLIQRPQLSQYVWLLCHYITFIRFIRL